MTSKHTLLGAASAQATVKSLANALQWPSSTRVPRFLPSDFGNDVDRHDAVEPAKSAFEVKAKIHRAIEAEGIPYSYVSANSFIGFFLPMLEQPGIFALPPPRDKVIIPGDGNPKAIFNVEHDIGTYTIKAVDDPRTLNKILYINPSKNIYSINELVSLWEKKIGKTIERIYIPEEQFLKQIQEAPTPMNLMLALNHSVFVKGDQTNIEIKPSFGVEASELYPDVKYTTVEEYLDQEISISPHHLRVVERRNKAENPGLATSGCTPGAALHLNESDEVNGRESASNKKVSGT
ncbi:hypothetical protein TEA_024524 [Camellia sinensis var. sinensis]|uniref:NmrA-like domain-containing protein n=1 Tax=Camellia sinensis var. sinensis TaxID=542762 RepID=A0A4S4DEY4_CAMSN|nr:hypothetical protein TEA_024524 [Camellia sinensis var. sinensis]